MMQNASKINVMISDISIHVFPSLEMLLYDPLFT